MNKKVKGLISGCLLVLAIALGVICFMTLPDTVVMQIGSGGAASGSMPKALAVTLPLIISLLGAFLSFKTEASYSAKSYVCAIAGIVVMLFELIFNR